MLVLMLVVFAGFCCVGIVSFGLMVRQMAPSLASTGACAMTMTFTKASIMEYVKQNGKYPEADKWQDQIEPLYARVHKKIMSEMDKSDNPLKAMFQLPPPGQPVTCSDGKVKTCFAFNEALSGKTKAEVKDKKTILIFEVTKIEKNAHGKYDPSEPFAGPSLMGQRRERFVMPIGKGKTSSADIEDLFDEDPPVAEAQKATPKASN